MRIEQIIAAVTRSVAIATVREIEGVVLFVNAVRLHLRQQRMPLGMPAYSGSLFGLASFDVDTDRTITGGSGNPCWSKRGILLRQPMLALASCPAGSVTA